MPYIEPKIHPIRGQKSNQIAPGKQGRHMRFYPIATWINSIMAVSINNSIKYRMAESQEKIVKLETVWGGRKEIAKQIRINYRLLSFTEKWSKGG
jgi:hypothetical protein